MGQMAEQKTHDSKVVSSIPGLGTKRERMFSLGFNYNPALEPLSTHHTSIA